MRVELIPGLDNVIRFPVERRAPATLELLYDIAPDIREVVYVAESFGLDAPEHDLYHQADRETAELILNQVPHERNRRRQEMLEEMRQAVITEAVNACRVAHDAGMAANEAHQRLLAAQTGRSWHGEVEHRSEQADRLTVAAAERLITHGNRVNRPTGDSGAR